MIQTKTAPFTLPALPYEQNALEPGISARAIGFHYGKHHQAYVNKLNELAAGSEFADLTLEEIIAKTSGDGFQAALFNNAAQAWNHTFYWNSLSPDGGGKPAGELGRKIEISFRRDGGRRFWPSTCGSTPIIWIIRTGEMIISQQSWINSLTGILPLRILAEHENTRSLDPWEQEAGQFYRNVELTLFN